MPHAPAPVHKQPRLTFGRRLLLLGQRILRSDHILITVIAVSMTLSAVAVYQATRAADEASDLLDESRIVSTEASRQVGYLQTMVDHDLDVLRTYCAAQAERDIARVTYLSDTPDIPALVTADLTLDALRPLLLGDQEAECSADANHGYDMRRAAERLESRRSDIASSASVGADLEAQAAVFHRDEALLMTAGFLFALVVAVIIAIDQLGSRAARPGRMRTRSAHRWQYRMLALGAVALVAGVVLLVLSAVDSLLTAAVLIGLALILVGEWAWLRRTRTTAREADPVTTVRRRARPQWWAEMIGAVALVAFTASAVGLSLVSIHEREATALADRESSLALDLQRVGQQQALRALASLSFIAQMDADEVTARQLQEEAVSGVAASGADPDAVAAVRDVVDERMRAADQDLREQAAATLARDDSPACTASASTEAPSPSALLEDIGSDPDYVLGYVLQQQVPSRACDVMAALSRQEAGIWASHGSTFTVALVVLGLAGFLLALASSTERSTRSSRTLLLIGAVGTGVGVVLALLPLPALVGGTGVPRGQTAQDFGDRLAAGESDSCTAGTDFDEAIAMYAGYGPAFVGRAYAADCEAAVQEWPAFSSEIEPDQVPAIIDDLERAVALGPVTPTLLSTLGWYEILHGIQARDRGSLQRGLEHTDEALGALGSHSDAVGNGIPITRFNRALALAALGDHHAALHEYQGTERCLELAAECAGGGLADAGVADDVRLGALADLELLRDAPEIDDYRRAVLGIPRWPGHGVELGEARFDVYPQELQVALREGYGPEGAKVVWYYRPDDTVAWGVLTEPSMTSIRGTGHLDFPVSAGWLLDTGEYRADVYSGSRRMVFETTYDSDASLARYESQRLGISMVVPAEWAEWIDDGVEWHLGPDEQTGVTVRRVEGMVPGEDVDLYLADQLDTWWATSGDVDMTPLDDGWMFGIPNVIVREGEDLDEDGFADTVDAAALAPYTSTGDCGGALFTVRTSSTADSPTARRLYDSIVLERALDRLPPHGEVLEADGISLTVPSWWDAAIRPPGGTGNLFSAKDCEGGASLLLSTDQADDRDLAGYIEDSIDYYVESPADFPSWTLESRTALDVAGADAAELLVFTWIPDGSTDPVRQWQMYGMRGGTVAYGTITTWAADLEYWQPDLEVILPSMVMTDP